MRPENYVEGSVSVGRTKQWIVMLTKKIVYGWNRPRSWGGELNLKTHISFLVTQNSLIQRRMRRFLPHKFQSNTTEDFIAEINLGLKESNHLLSLYFDK